MRPSEGVMGKCGTFVSFLVLLYCVSLSECKRSACWRYGHSCWGGHGKRSGVGLSGEIMNRNIGMVGGTGSPAGESRMLGMLDKATGRFVPFPVLSMMMMMRNRDSIIHPPVGVGRGNIPTYPQQGGQRSIGLMKIKRSGLNIGGAKSAGDDTDERNDNAGEQRENLDDESNVSGSLDQTISKVSDEGSNRSGKTGEWESADDFTSDDLSSSGESQLPQTNAIFMRARKPNLPSTENNKSSEQVNLANEEDSQEVASLRKPHDRFLLKTKNLQT